MWKEWLGEETFLTQRREILGAEALQTKHCDDSAAEPKDRVQKIFSPRKQPHFFPTLVTLEDNNNRIRNEASCVLSLCAMYVEQTQNHTYHYLS